MALIAVSLLPDLDVLAFRFGIPYSAPFGHRGATHSLVFALVAGTGTALAVANGRRRDFWRVAIVICLVAVSHPLLDAMTDGGLGVALLWPFSNARFFAPWRPITHWHLFKPVQRPQSGPWGRVRMRRCTSRSYAS